MQNNLGNYYKSLQARYGDPRVYAQQEEEMRRDEAAVEYARSKNREQLLNDAYERQKDRNRALHNAKVSSRAPPQSSKAPRQSRKKEPPSRDP